MEDKNIVLLKDLAQELGMDKSNLRRYVLKNKIELLKIRSAETMNQLTLALTLEDAETIKELRNKSGFSSKKYIPQTNGDGYFYVIQLVPELDQSRVKLGFTSNIESRLQAHRTAAPTATLLVSFECKRTWEAAAMASITRVECEHIKNEVYSCSNLDNLIQRASGFFAIMPSK